MPTSLNDIYVSAGWLVVQKAEFPGDVLIVGVYFGTVKATGVLPVYPVGTRVACKLEAAAITATINDNVYAMVEEKNVVFSLLPVI